MFRYEDGTLGTGGAFFGLVEPLEVGPREPLVLALFIVSVTEDLILIAVAGLALICCLLLATRDGALDEYSPTTVEAVLSLRLARDVPLNGSGRSLKSAIVVLRLLLEGVSSLEVGGRDDLGFLSRSCIRFPSVSAISVPD